MELLLLGAGHAHVEVLRRLARSPVRKLRLSVIACEPDAHHTAMLPGVIRGDYPPSAARIPLAPLAAAAGARLIVAEAIGLDLDRRCARLRAGGEAGFDLLSLDLGGMPAFRPGQRACRSNRSAGSWRFLRRRSPHFRPRAVRLR